MKENPRQYQPRMLYSPIAVSLSRGMFRLTARRKPPICGINRLTYMSTPPEAESKRRALQTTATFNPRAAAVRHALFQKSDFFDPRDLLQLKYETVRAVQVEGYSIAQAAAEFGLSRPTIYQAQAQLEQAGLPGLLPHKRGPKQPHKLTMPVQQFLGELRAGQPGLSVGELARRVRQRFRVTLHPRTIEKALPAGAKRGRPKSP